MGRKPKQDKPMTGAEKSRRHRLKLMQGGKSQVYFTMSNEMIKQIDELASFFNLSGRAEVISSLLKSPIANALKAAEEVKNNPDVLTLLNDYPQEVELVDKIKAQMWSINTSSPSELEQMTKTLQENAANTEKEKQQ